MAKVSKDTDWKTLAFRALSFASHGLMCTSHSTDRSPPGPCNCGLSEITDALSEKLLVDSLEPITSQIADQKANNQAMIAHMAKLDLVLAKLESSIAGRPLAALNQNEAVASAGVISHIANLESALETIIANIITNPSDFKQLAEEALHPQNVCEYRCPEHIGPVCITRVTGIGPDALVMLCYAARKRELAHGRLT